MTKCTKCKKEKLDDEFNFKIKSKGLRQLQCKACTRLLIRNHYNRNKEYYLQKTHRRNAELKSKTFLYIKGFLANNHCVDCGESDITVLEFDHKGSIPKFRAVSSLMKNRYSLEKIKEEIAKCEIRCANCHRRKTARDFKWTKSI